MAETRYLIIGGGVAGTTAADTIRKQDATGAITIVSDEPYRFYSRIMISKLHYFLGKVPADQIWLKKEEWYRDNRVNLIAGRTAAKLDTAAKTVILDDGTMLGYDKLLLAIGIRARRWTVPGSDKQGIHYVRTLDDFKGITADVKTARQAVVIGGGAIGFEVCELFQASGLDTTLVIREPHYWDPVLDAGSGQMIEKALEKAGVKIVRGKYVTEAYGGERVEGVILESGEKLPCQIVSVGIGGVCPLDFAKAAGLATNRGLVANEYLETSAPDIWAAGDCAEYQDLIFGERTQFGSWSNAQSQGRTVGANMSGRHEPYRLVTFYAVSGLGLSIAFIGSVAPPGAGRDVVPRGSPEANSYARLLLKDNRIVGATLMNRTADIGPISKLIEKQTDVAGRYSELADTNFDLKSLLS
ncbi:MAG: FAD-dependent oxidoreductase [Patescibacteria group bacterium]|jgi:NAD(P)H-nitrite reductase large subunit